jgi:hypothetical protein
VGGISKAVTNFELQEVFRTDALVGRYYRKGNVDFAKILVPDDELDRALSQDSSSHGHKFCVAKWHDAKAPSSRAHRSAQVSATSWGCRKMSSAAYIASVAEFFMAAQAHGQARPPLVLQKSLRGQRLYSQVASEKAAETRMKSMEIALRDVKRLLERSTVKLPSS